MTTLPSGTVTFLFTDIENSTQTAEALGDARWAEALETHRSLLRAAFAAHDGAEVGTEGDSFFVAFSRAHDAVDAAIEGQNALASQDLRVRMGIHTGEALVRDGGYVGHEVHRAKRISDAGNGGQIVVSQTTADLLAGIDLRALGPHRLKDLGEPQQLFQVGAGDFPPLRSLESFRHNLPPQRSTFVGRENEIALVRKLIDEHRIVTLTGVGGCGKTRLALQVGAELLDAYADGVFFVDLAPIGEASLVAGTTAGAVGVALAEGTSGAVSGPADQVLLDYLERRSCLVVLDNCEHLRDAAADTADRILGNCPDVKILATSREALEIEGERSFTVPSLSLPDDRGASSSEAISLFGTRASEVRPDFALTPDNIGAVASICRRLDGIPLAIEFAASRVSHLTPHEIDKRLAESFRLLAGGRRRVQRQQTIAATLDWSHELLSEPERVLLRRLSVFAGSFTLEAAEGIASGGEIGRFDVLDLLASLVAKSLVTATEQAGRSRYRLLETVRLYGAEKLRDAGESEETHARHRDWYLAFVEATPWDHVFTSTVWLNDLSAEYPNLTAALEWSAGEERYDLLARMTARMYPIWSVYHEDGYRWALLKAPEDLDIEVDDRVACLLVAANTAVWAQNLEAAQLGTRAIVATEGRSSEPAAMALISRALTRSVEAAFTRDPDITERVRREIVEAFEMARDMSPFALAMFNYIRGFAEITMGAFDRAKQPLLDAVEQMDPEHHLMTRVAAISALTGLAHVQGRHDEAARWAQQAVDHLEVWPNWKSGVVSTGAAAFAGAGDFERANDLLAKWIDDIVRSGLPGSVEEAMVGFMAVLALRGDLERALRISFWVRSRTFDRLLPIRSPVSYPIYLHYARFLRDSLGHDEAQRARVEAGALSQDDAIAFALDWIAR